MIRLNSAQLWQRLEFSITNVPTAVNPFDPDIIRVDTTFTTPSSNSDAEILPRPAEPIIEAAV